MALKAVVTDLTRPTPYMIMVEFDIRKADTNELVLAGSHGFNIVTNDVNGAVVPETDQQKMDRLKLEFDNYVDALMISIGVVDAGFDWLRGWAVGYVREG